MYLDPGMDDSVFCLQSFTFFFFFPLSHSLSNVLQARYPIDTCFRFGSPMPFG